MYALAVTLVSLFVGKILKVFGRSRTLYTGMIIMGFSMIGFGLITFIPEDINFIITA